MQSDHNLNESVASNDLRGLVGDLVSIDQFKTKLSDDENALVIAFKVSGKEPAEDLSQFIETGFTALDVDVSPGPDEDGMYTVFVEVERKSDLFDKISVILDDVQRVDNDIEKWMFVSYENKTDPQEFNKENFDANIITSSYDYVVKYNEDAQALSERIKFLNKY